jgi:hypothetical protein
VKLWRHCDDVARSGALQSGDFDLRSLSFGSKIASMKLLLALIAIVFAATNIAAATMTTNAPAEQSAAGLVSGAQACHLDGRASPLGDIGGCDNAAFCALICGVVPPATANRTPMARFTMATFDKSVHQLDGTERKPEAPPPRRDVL